MTSIAEEIGVSFRSLVRAPRYALLTIGCLAIGLGVNALMFGIVDVLFLRPPEGVRDPANVARVYFNRAGPSGTRRVSDRTSYPVFSDIKSGAAGLEQAAAYYKTIISEGRGSEASKLRAGLVSGGFFGLLGVRAGIGRMILPTDSRAGSERVAVISHALWRSRFGADSSSIGRVLVIANRTYRIVGVAPQGFSGIDLEPLDLWLALEQSADDLIYPNYLDSRGAWAVAIIGRLKQDGTRVQAEVDATRALLNGSRGFRGFDSTESVALAPLLRELGPAASDQARVSKWLTGVALAVLAIACVNCGSLMLLRTTRRQAEFGLRIALGATRLRLVRAVVLENVAIVIAGAVVAVGLAAAGDRTLATLLFPESTPIEVVSLPRVFGFTLFIGFLAVLVCSLGAMRYLSHGDLAGALKAGSGAIAPRSFSQNILLVAQVGLTVLLLIGTGLFARSLRNAKALDLGFRPADVMVVSVDFAGMVARPSSIVGEPDVIFRRFQEAIQAIPGVISVATTSSVPFGDLTGVAVSIPGRDQTTLPKQPVFLVVASEDYLSTIGLHLVRGRWFESADYGSGGRNVVVNESMAQLYWPGESAIGKCLVAGSTDCRQIVGIVGDTKFTSLRENPRAQLYLPDIADPSQSARLPRTLVVRTVRGPEIAPAIRRAMQSVNPNLAFVGLQPLDAVLESKLRPWNMGTTMFAVFGTIALVLASVGLYGSMSYAVTARSREIGIRVALGATTSRIVALVALRTLYLTVVGVASGAAVAVWLGRLVEGLLFGVHASHSPVFLEASAIVITAATLSCGGPVWRATKVEPVDILNST